MSGFDNVSSRFDYYRDNVSFLKRIGNQPMDYDDAWMYKLHAAKAVQGIERNGCYWFIAMRPSYGIVPELLREVGYSVITFNPPPDYEFAVYLSDNYPPIKDIEEIARLRQEMRDEGGVKTSFPPRYKSAPPPGGFLLPITEHLSRCCVMRKQSYQ